MIKTESRIITFILGTMIPILTFVYCLLIVSAIHMFNIVTLPTSLVIKVSFAGLGIGILLDIFYLKKWTAGFYNTNLRLMILIYISIISLYSSKVP